MTTKNSSKKGSIGRQRIPMAKIQKESHRQVTFSKRRAGLFKKASELCTLCGAEVAIIVFSPAKKPFSFGHPNVESVLDRYISKTNMSFPQAQTQTQTLGSGNNDLNARLTQVLNELEEEKKKGQAMEGMSKSRRRKNWWELPLEEMNLDQLQQMKSALEELSKTILMTKRSLPEMMAAATASTAAAAAGNSAAAFGCYESKVVPYHMMNMASSSGMSSIYNFGYGHGF